MKPLETKIDMLNGDSWDTKITKRKKHFIYLMDREWRSSDFQNKFSPGSGKRGRSKRGCWNYIDSEISGIRVLNPVHYNSGSLQRQCPIMSWLKFPNSTQNKIGIEKKIKLDYISRFIPPQRCLRCA